MKASRRGKIIATVWIVAWLGVVLLLWGLMDPLSFHMTHVLVGNKLALPAHTWFFAIPVIGGLRGVVPVVGVTWVTYAVWGCLFGWPLVTLVLIWRARNARTTDRVFLYSVTGYAILFVAVALYTAAGLWAPFM